ncbi:reprolysin-like metallopeptidase [Desulfopila sp. IMCC35008]|uniref:reprolysin-like metallopeptidase n=1 Tax=Desulfopila sp. IMCC35008 TaxID=2653858 RepID=UPI0013D490B8|nr:M12 family metallo-peptidase [Desulfopila sp. IMCC35008]
MRQTAFLLILLTLFSGCSVEQPEQDSKKDSPAQSQAAAPGKPAPTAVPSVASTESIAQQVEKTLPFLQNIQSTQQGERIPFHSPTGETYEFKVINHSSSSKGNTNLTAIIEGCDTCSMTLVTGKSGSFGRIQTPETTYQLTVENGQARLIDLYAPGNVIVPKINDTAIPPRPQQRPESQAATDTTAVPEPPAVGLGEQITSSTTIDLMILYSAGMVQDYPGDLLQTRLNYLVTLTNEAYQRSNINAAVRLVHSQQVAFADSLSNDAALTAITNGTAPFEDTATLRTNHGADLVMILRSYQKDSHGGCGLTWVTGNNGDFTGYAGYGYSAVSDGSDGNYYCTDLTATHELGHNLGTTHDRANAGSASPAYPYAYGYGISGSFGTIMSYISPEINRFSNPEQVVCGPTDAQIACGVDENASNSANNTLSINYSAPAVAGFVATQHSADVDNDGTIDLEDTVKALQISAGMPSAQSTNIYEDIDGDGRIGVQEAIHALQQQ